eukprot:EC819500.1.p1 GENE.EC819500.1~~EC819500.1.p1  ORF type:complete len:77 (-),score=6.18 EC819500.1:146-376(-)
MKKKLLIKKFITMVLGSGTFNRNYKGIINIKNDLNIKLNKNFNKVYFVDESYTSRICNNCIHHGDLRRFFFFFFFF